MFMERTEDDGYRLAIIILQLFDVVYQTVEPEVEFLVGLAALL